ncbi:MAG: hypothetical protein ACP5PX_07610, partial [Candidatus Hadarchaeum sp.]|uniref:hypothetical protein n=1 Tax=Candidatus Hadarchaeum sp. TaxID=2883567 RepID=UPI003D0C0D99
SFVSFCHSEGAKRPKNLRSFASLRMTRAKKPLAEGFFGFRRPLFSFARSLPDTDVLLYKD